MAPSTFRADARAAMAEGPGLSMGTKAPVSLLLRNAAGKPKTLAASMGAKGVAGVMVHFADWCPYCKAQLVSLNGINSKIIAMGYSLVIAKDGTVKAKTSRLIILFDLPMQQFSL